MFFRVIERVGFLSLMQKFANLREVSREIFFTLMLIGISIFNYGQSYKTKVVEYDWTKRGFTENKSRFPFDEPFSFRVIGLKEKQKVDVTIIDITKNNKDDSTILKTAGTVIDETGVFSEVISRYLRPNHYFKISIIVEEESKLKSTTRDSLIKVMSDDPAFVNKIQQIFFSSEYLNLNVEEFTKLYEDYFNDNNLANLKIDRKTVNSQMRNVKGPIAQALNNLLNINERLQALDSTIILQLTGKTTRIDSTTSIKTTDVKKKKELLTEKERVNESLQKTKEFFNSLYTVKGSLPYLVLNPTETLSDFLTRTDTLKISDDLRGLLKSIDTSLLKQVDDELGEIRKDFQSFNTAIISSISTVLSQIYLNSAFFNSILGSNVYDNSTEAGIYTSQTFGYGYSPKTDNGLTYFSFSFFVRPVNNSVPLSNVKGWDNLKVRLCANVGLTLQDIATNKHGEISGLGSVFGSKAGLVGLGIRPLSFLKVDVNALLYYMKNPNPLITNKKFVASPFFGVSVNLNIVKLLAGQPNSLTTLQNEIKSNQQ